MTTPNVSAAAVTPEQILKVGLGFWGSKTLLSAVEMELLLSSRGIRERPRSCKAGWDFIRGRHATSSTHWSHSGSCSVIADVGGLLEMANHRFYPFWGSLTEALRTGSPQNEAKTGGLPLFAALYADPMRLREFLKAMSGISHGANLARRETVFHICGAGL